VPRRLLTIAISFALSLFVAGRALAQQYQKGGLAAFAMSPVVTPTPPAIPQVSHILLVSLENHDPSAMVGNTYMPYVNGLIRSGTYLNNFYADVHPSIGNYFIATTGVDVTNDDSVTPTSCGSACDLPSVFRAMQATGITWKSYCESIPSTGYLGGDSGLYLVHHCFSPYELQNDPALSGLASTHLFGITQLSTDLANHQLPKVMFVTPNGVDDWHNNTNLTTDAAVVDNWLKTNIDPLIKSTDFGAGVFILWMDESRTTNSCSSTVSSGCGGLVPMVLYGMRVKVGYTETRYYQQGGIEKLLYNLLGLSPIPGTGASANDMSDVFTTPTATVR
jgi:phosphatidylinositol-3-phosphatase